MGALMVTEEQKLARCEKIIDRGMATFVEVGQALQAIRDERLYRDTHKTFAAYLKSRWNLSKSRAYQLIDASEAAENVQHVGQKPNARQAAELSKAPEELQSEVWDRVVEDHGEEVTAAKVADAVAEASAELAGPKPPANGAEVTPAANRKRLNEAFGVIQRFVDDRGIRSPEISGALNAIYQEIRQA